MLLGEVGGEVGRVALEVRYDTENDDNSIQRHGAVRRQACCLEKVAESMRQK